MVVFGQKWLYSGKSGCIRAKVVVLKQSGSNQAKMLYSSRVVVFGQKKLYSGKSVCIWAKWLYSGKSGFMHAN